MQIREITDKRLWQDTTPTGQPVEFLQSWYFGDILQAAGRSILRLKVGEQYYLQGIITKKRFGVRALYLPYVNVSPAALAHLLPYLKSQGFTYLRLEPVSDVGDTVWPKKIAPHAQAQYRWTLDTTRTLAVLMADMHQKTRYNIHLAERKGVRIHEEKNLNLFCTLDRMTTERNVYPAHARSYYAALLSSPKVIQTTAYFEDIPIASSILLQHEGTLIYLFGASNNEYRNSMAPTLLQWYNIGLASRLGAHTYDFLGVAPPVSGDNQEDTASFHKYAWDTRHPYSRLTKFKAGFAGSVRSLPEAYDFILEQKKYSLHQVLKKLHLA